MSKLFYIKWYERVCLIQLAENVVHFRWKRESALGFYKTSELLDHALRLRFT